MAARLQRHVESRAPGTFAGRADRLGLRVGRAVLREPAFADNLLFAHEHGADERVRLDVSPASLGELEQRLSASSFRPCSISIVIVAEVRPMPRNVQLTISYDSTDFVG